MAAMKTTSRWERNNDVGFDEGDRQLLSVRRVLQFVSRGSRLLDLPVA